MGVVGILKNKKIRVKEIPAWGVYLRKRWDEEFAAHLSHREKESIFLYDEDGLCGFLWHIFSYEKKEYLEKEQAERAFEMEPKGFCYLFYQHFDHALLIENASALYGVDLVDEEDVYIVDKEFTWTFVITHEKGWYGPYFARNK